MTGTRVVIPAEIPVQYEYTTVLIRLKIIWLAFNPVCICHIRAVHPLERSFVCSVSEANPKFIGIRGSNLTKDKVTLRGAMY